MRGGGGISAQTGARLSVDANIVLMWVRLIDKGPPKRVAHGLPFGPPQNTVPICFGGCAELITAALIAALEPRSAILRSESSAFGSFPLEPSQQAPKQGHTQMSGATLCLL